MGTNVLAMADRRLNSWKEIGSFFSRDERTVKRWEAQRGLPVRRIPGPGNTKVFGYVGELTAWLNSSGSPRSAPLLLARSVPAEGKMHRTPHPRARELCLAGMYFCNLQTPEALARAVDHFTQAIALDPDDAPSHAGLGACYLLQHRFGRMVGDMAHALARTAAERAITLDGRLSEAVSLMGAVRFYGAWDVAGALEAFKRALALAPASWEARHRHATVLLQIGRFDAALTEISAAQAINPIDRPTLADKGRILFHVGRQADAATLLTQLTEVAPDFPAPHAYLAELHLSQCAHATYLAASLRAATLRGERRRCIVLQAAARALDRGGAVAMIQSLLAGYRRLHAEGNATFYDLAQAHAIAGDGAVAMTQLRRAVTRRETQALDMLIDPAFASMRGHAAFRRLVERLGIGSHQPAVGAAATEPTSGGQSPRQRRGLPDAAAGYGQQDI